MEAKSLIRLFSLVAALSLTGCLDTNQVGIPSNAQAQYSKIGLVTQISDNVVSTYWDAAFAEPQPIDGKLGWNAASAAGGFVKEQLTPTGAVVANVPSHTGAAAQRRRRPTPSSYFSKRPWIFWARTTIPDATSLPSAAGCLQSAPSQVLKKPKVKNTNRVLSCGFATLQ